MLQPYSCDYNAVVKQAKQEIDSGFEPPIKSLAVNPGNYKTIIIGSPVWWYTFAPPFKTMLSACDWSNKTVYPFYTHGGGPGLTLKNIGISCQKAIVKRGLSIYFNASNEQKSMDIINARTDAIR